MKYFLLKKYLEPEWKVVDKVSGKVIADNFHDFCKCGLMTDKTNIMYVKDAENDFEFHYPNKIIYMEQENTISNRKPKWMHDLGVRRVMQNSTDGYYEILLQDYIDKPILNPETLHGKLLWFTHESGYDYNHPESRAKERAEKICNAYNEYDQLKANNEIMLEALKRIRDTYDNVEDLAGKIAREAYDKCK